MNYMEMKIMRNNSPILIVLLVVVLILFLQRECTRQSVVETPTPEPVYIYDTITLVDTIVPEPILVTLPGDTIKTTDTIFINDGSISDNMWNVLEAHFTRKFYNEVLIDDSSAYFKLNFELYTNDVHNLNYVFLNKRPVEVICPEIPKNRTKLFVGGNISGNPTTFGAGPSVALLTRKDNLYSYNYNIINNVHSVSMYYKLKFR